MLVILRIIFGGALWYMIMQVRENAQLHPDTGDLANAGYLAICVALGILNALALRFNRHWRIAAEEGPVHGSVRAMAALSLAIWAGAVLAGRWIGFLQ